MDLNRRIFDIVSSLDIPTGVNEIRERASGKNWESAKSILLELAMDGEIKAIKTSHGYLFMMREEKTPGHEARNPLPVAV
jgi:hypothetical protein